MWPQRNGIEDFADEPGRRCLIRMKLGVCLAFHARQVPRIDHRCRIRAESRVEAFSLLPTGNPDEIQWIGGDGKRTVLTNAFHPIPEDLGQPPATRDHVLLSDDGSRILISSPA